LNIWKKEKETYEKIYNTVVNRSNRVVNICFGLSEGGSGHYTLLLPNFVESENCTFRMEVSGEPVFSFYQKLVRVKSGERVLNNDYNEVRHYTNRRDERLMEDTLRKYLVTTEHRFFGCSFNTFLRRSLVAMACLLTIISFTCGGISAFINVAISSLYFCFYIYWRFWLKPFIQEELLISENVANKVLEEMITSKEIGVDPEKALLSVVQTRMLNRRADLVMVPGDTAKLCKILIENGINSGSFLKGIRTEGMTAYNVNPSDIVVKQDDLINVALNQVGGLGSLTKDPLFNSVNSVLLARPSGTKSKPVAISPIGLPITNNGPLGPGLFMTTDSTAVLSSFIVRSMTQKNPVNLPNKDLKVKFVDWSIKLLRRFIDTIGEVEPETEHIEFFKKHYAGKKPKLYIERIVREYNEFVLSGRCKREFLQHGCFVKFENSLKRYGSEIHVKPRLIMTMSDLMLVECCQVLKLIHSWNASKFSRFQVKDLEPEEMVKRIIEATEGGHNVTDYSAFESSVDSIIRMIEGTLLRDMCRKFNYSQTLISLNKHYKLKWEDSSRILSYRGSKYKIFTRCSGDFWTSFGNGVVNFALMAFCKYGHLNPESVNIDEFKMLAEGDDGLVPVGTANKETISNLGFSFSVELNGEKPGDCDFLSSRWVAGKRFLNVGKCLSIFWVKKASHLSEGKQKYLLKCAANSLYHLSPGHPVISAIVNRIWKVCSDVSPFKNASNYLKGYNLDYSHVAIKRVEVDDSMRAVVAEGAEGFPPISIPAQLALEKIFEHDQIMYISSILNDYTQVNDYVDSLKYLKEQNGQFLKYDGLKIVSEVLNLVSHYEVVKFGNEANNLLSLDSREHVKQVAKLSMERVQIGEMEIYYPDNLEHTLDKINKY